MSLWNTTKLRFPRIEFDETIHKLFASYGIALLQAGKDRGGAANAFNLTSMSLKMTKFLRKKGRVKNRKDPRPTEEGDDYQGATSSRRKEGARIGLASGFDPIDGNRSHVALGLVTRNGRRPLPNISPDRQTTVASVGSCARPTNNINLTEMNDADVSGDCANGEVVGGLRRSKVANRENTRGDDRTDNDYLQFLRGDDYDKGEVILHRTVQ